MGCWGWQRLLRRTRLGLARQRAGHRRQHEQPAAARRAAPAPRAGRFLKLGHVRLAADEERRPALKRGREQAERDSRAAELALARATA